MTEDQKILARKLFAIGAIRFGSFHLKHHEQNPLAPPSPIFCELGITQLGGPVDEETLRLIGEQFYAVVRSENIRFQRIAGMPEAGKPLAAALAFASTGIRAARFFTCRKPLNRGGAISPRKSRASTGRATSRLSWTMSRRGQIQSLRGLR